MVGIYRYASFIYVRKGDKLMKKRNMAIIYDFDGTLGEGNMQEYVFLPSIGNEPKKFWKKVKDTARENQVDETLVYLHLMIKEATYYDIKFSKQDLLKQGKKIKFFDGLDKWFQNINGYASKKNITLEHYIISSGNQEIIEGTKIKKNFKKIYASRFVFDSSGNPLYVGVAVNHTLKTQYLFRINKNKHDSLDHREVNEYIEESERYIPFENMVFIGDGETDIPCFSLVKNKGGLAIAVYKPNTKNMKESSQKYLKEKRVHAVVAADYREGKDIDKIVKAQIDLVSAQKSKDDLLKALKSL